MNLEESQLQQVGGSIKQTAFQAARALIKKGIEKAVVWGSTKLLGAATAVDPEPITKVILAVVDVGIAAGKFVWDNVFKKALIELKRKPLHTFIAGAGLIALPAAIAMPAGVALASQVGGGFLSAHGAINGIFQSGSSFGRGVFNLATKPIEITADIIDGLAVAESAAIPAFVGISSTVVSGGVLGILTAATLAAAFYVPTVSRPSTLIQRTEYFKVEKYGEYYNEAGDLYASLITQNEFVEGEIRSGGKFVYHVKITPLKENITIDPASIKAEDARYFYGKDGTIGPEGFSGSLAELDYDHIDLEGPLQFTYELSVDPEEKFKDVMIVNYITVTAAVTIEENGEQKTETDQIASDSLTVIIGDVPNECPNGWPVNTSPIKITQGPGGSETHSSSEATDFGNAPLGTPIYSTTKGYAEIFTGGDYGNHVIVKSLCSGVDLDVTYAHLSDISVSDGQIVNFGDKIGEVGNTGNSQGYHLHYQFDSPNNLIKMEPPYLPVFIPRDNNCTLSNPCYF